MRLLHAVDHRRMTWKNGGGETLEVAISPTDAGLGDFDWRVSMAVVTGDGPFSAFPAIDRTLVLLDGDGMILDISGHDPATLTPRSAPLSFPADVATAARLTGGAITDVNVMTARGRCAHIVERFAGARDLRVAPGETLLLLGDGLIVTTAAERAMLGPRDVAMLEAGETARAGPGGLIATIRRLG